MNGATLICTYLLHHWTGITFLYDEHEHSSDSSQFFTDANPSVDFNVTFFFFLLRAVVCKLLFSLFYIDSSSALYNIYSITVTCYVWGCIGNASQCYVTIKQLSTSSIKGTPHWKVCISWEASCGHPSLKTSSHKLYHLSPNTDTLLDAVFLLAFYACLIIHSFNSFKHSRKSMNCNGAELKYHVPDAFCPYLWLLKLGFSGFLCWKRFNGILYPDKTFVLSPVLKLIWQALL